jgi:hypothetical protein
VEDAVAPQVQDDDKKRAAQLALKLSESQVLYFYFFITNPLDRV